MKIYKLLIELEVDDKMMYGNDEESREWFEKDILKNYVLVLHEEIGDDLGYVKVLAILPE